MSTQNVLCKGITESGEETVVFTSTATGHQLVKIASSAVTLAGDMSARTDIADDTTSKFLKCSAAGKLEVEATSSLPTGASTEAKQDTINTTLGTLSTHAKQDTIITALADLSDGTQISKAMGSEDGATTGTQRQLRVDGNGRLSVDINSGVPSVTRNSGGHASGVGMGMMGFEGATARGVSCDSNGEVKVLCGYTDIADDTTFKRLLVTSLGEQKTVNRTLAVNNREDMGATWSDGTLTTA